ncbi:2,3-bisphosphoglycerate-independent phosphoglycerate mutase [Kiritimatiella glycovorans]|uniref:2,3-bisphosphoglycerate-independent phosphoglycerate mutase n=1 Tax=Kiritimatiella glycovorans TaxID=1307763 RepID=A0A0G3EER1_9BACT|nr:2,3-bisphosphoglycerate-independent phosphoglycerate mutase [Kiritimatiella glycovorans]AKJ63867.1 2,3-bisphosphoglycerate-independent phosphoglycerate mutase [Kiritimatiella glycovorans]
MESLKKHPRFAGVEGPVVLVVMDGIGIGRQDEGNLVHRAKTPNIDWLAEHAIASQLKAHGTAVGLPTDGDMGNSEVGHNAIGAGRIFNQGAARINTAIEDGVLWDGEVWRELTGNVKERKSTLHFIGLFSDGNVHSHLDHLRAMLRRAKDEGVGTVRIHALLDGRDVPPTSALEYIDDFEGFLADLNAEHGVDYAIASGGGRMNITMDRYEADWDMVARGWKIHVRGEGRAFSSAREAVETFRGEKPGILDQDLPGFVIERDGAPVGPVRDGDSVILFNYRGDRAIELSRAFDEDPFDKFDRGPRPDVKFAGMMQYDGDLEIPKKFLVPPPHIDRTIGEYLSKTGVKQLALSETQKFGHVTYFFNGNRSGKFNPDYEDYVEIPSDRCPFEDKPEMKAKELTDKTVEAIESGRYRFIRLNYPNGDMVGHTGVFEAVIRGIEAVDEGVGRIMEAVKKTNGALIASADHGNSDDMAARDKKTGEILRDEHGRPRPKTAHSLNPVPVYVYDPSGQSNARLSGHPDLGISSLAATSLVLMGYEPPEDYTPSVVEVG